MAEGFYRGFMQLGSGIALMSTTQPDIDANAEPPGAAVGISVKLFPHLAADIDGGLPRGVLFLHKFVHCPGKTHNRSHKSLRIFFVDRADIAQDGRKGALWSAGWQLHERPVDCCTPGFCCQHFSLGPSRRLSSGAQYYA